MLCMHIGSSSKMPSTSPDAPFIISSTLTFQNAMGSMLDYIFSGTLERFPTLTIAYSEGQVGWMPYILERADKLWEERSDNSFGTSLPKPPSHYMPGRVYGCIFDDETGHAEPGRHRHGADLLRDRLPARRLDVPAIHARCSSKIATEAQLTTTRSTSSPRGNAIRAFGLERFGITE